MPPYKSIEIPWPEIGEHFDMVQDNNNTLYVSSVTGVKIFDGSSWELVEIEQDTLIRRLHFDGEKRVYVGGNGIIGYIETDSFGKYKFTDITPKNFKGKFNTIWHITKCNNQIFFQDVYDIFKYDTEINTVKNWHFTSKLSGMNCINQQMITQDRSSGLLVLKDNEWVKSQIELKNNELIYHITSISDDTVFLLTESDDWRIIKDNKIQHLNFSKQLPNLDNYVSIASLNDNKFVMGSNNGLLTFISVNNLEAESFQLTNEWISKIIKTQNNELLVLTEYEVFFIDWPSAIRIQAKETGLSSNITDIVKWNNNSYVASSSGVFIEDKEQLVYQHKLFRRLDWTNKEAWSLLPLSNQQILLAESHHLFLINNQDKTSIISDVIYPRELTQSKYNAELIFVITEYELQLLYKKQEDWKFKTLLNYRPTSVLEIEPGRLYVSDLDGEIHNIEFDLEKGALIRSTKFIRKNKTSDKNNPLLLIEINNQDIYAYNSDKTYRYKDTNFVEADFFDIAEVLNGEELNGLLLGEEGRLVGFSLTKLLFQDIDNKWQALDLKNYMKGIINKIEYLDNEIKILSRGIIITYLSDKAQQVKETNFKLNFTDITFSDSTGDHALALKPQQKFSYKQGQGALSFSYVLTDIKNHDLTKYRYQLIGHENSGSYIAKNQVKFDNLPAGSYKLKIQAKDSTGKVYNSDNYHFIVTPYWYLTVLAKFLWVLLSLAIVYLLFSQYLKWREKIHEAQKLALKKIIFKKTIELKKLNFSLQKMAHQDGLTGLSNRMYLDDYIGNIIDKDIKKISVIMMDMDHFKKYNDQNGHIAGDELLKKLAGYLNDVFTSENDIVARYGGEEFVAILIDNSLEQTKDKAENIRTLIENKTKNTSISIGISESNTTTNLKDSDDIYHLIDLADKALYCAKDKGRNRIEVYTEK